MKTKNMIAAMMLMTITAAMPAMAGNKKTHHHGKNDKVVVVHNDRGSSHFDKVDRALSNHDFNKGHAYRPEVKTCTVKLNRHDSYKRKAEKAKHMKGVMNTKWNPRTRELTIIYDAKVTTARHIRHFMV